MRALASTLSEELIMNSDTNEMISFTPYIIITRNVFNKKYCSTLSLSQQMIQAEFVWGRQRRT